MTEGFQNQIVIHHDLQSLTNRVKGPNFGPSNLSNHMTEKISHKRQILEKRLELRKQIWPTITDADLWTHRRKDGFIPIPRVMPLILQIMNDLASRPVASTYLDLWCRKFDEQFLTLNKNQREYAFYAGFSGQRGEQTWKERIRELAKLGFIMTEKGPYGEISYVLIVNPLIVITRHVEKGTPGLRKEYINALLDRGNQVKAKDLEDPLIQPTNLPRIPSPPAFAKK